MSRRISLGSYEVEVDLASLAAPIAKVSLGLLVIGCCIAAGWLLVEFGHYSYSESYYPLPRWFFLAVAWLGFTTGLFVAVLKAAYVFLRAVSIRRNADGGER